MGRSRRDGALWARIARRGGTDPSVAGADAEFLTLDAVTGALIVTGAGAAASATALRIADAVNADEARVVGQRLQTTDQHAQPLTDAQLRATPLPVSFPPDEAGLTNAELRATAVPVATGLAQPLTDAQLGARGLATEATLAALPPLVDGLEALLSELRDTVYRRTDPLPAGTNVIGSVIDRLEARILLNMASAAYTTGGVSATFATGDLSRAALDVNVTAVAGVAPELRLFLDRMGADGVWYPIYSPASRTAVGTVSTTIGQGMAVGQSLAASCRFRWEVTGTNPSFTFSVSVVGK